MLSTLNDIREFVRYYDLSEISSKSRKNAISQLLRILEDIPLDQLIKMINSANKGDINNRSLGRWARIILKENEGNSR